MEKEEKTVKIDLEENSQSGKPHPEHDPGVIILYRIKIDAEYFETRNRHEKGQTLYDLVNKDPKKYQLFQISKEHGHLKELPIEPNDTVDFGAYGIERFITKRMYCFKIDKKEYRTEYSTLTVRQILENFAKVNPSEKTLAIKIDGGFREYKNLDEEIPLENCPEFTLFDNSPLPVS